MLRRITTLRILSQPYESILYHFKLNFPSLYCITAPRNPSRDIPGLTRHFETVLMSTIIPALAGGALCGPQPTFHHSTCSPCLGAGAKLKLGRDLSFSMFCQCLEQVIISPIRAPFNTLMSVY